MQIMSMCREKQERKSSQIQAAPDRQGHSHLTLRQQTRNLKTPCHYAEGKASMAPSFSSLRNKIYNKIHLTERPNLNLYQKLSVRKLKTQIAKKFS